MDHQTRALEYRLADADDAMKDWFNQADAITDEYQTFAVEVATDETLSEVGRMQALSAQRSELHSKFTPLREKLEKRANNLMREREKVTPRPTLELDPMTRDRLIRAFTSANDDRRAQMLRELSDHPELALALAEECTLVTSVTDLTQERARNITHKSPDPEKLEKLNGDLQRVADAVEFLDLKMEAMR